MPKVSWETGRVEDMGPIEDRVAEIDGYTIDFIKFGEDADGTELLAGLPGDQCACPHWGYVLEGSFRFRIGDEEEAYEKGDAFYTPPGHIPFADAGTEVVMFSPTEELKVTEDAMRRNMERLQDA